MSTAALPSRQKTYHAGTLSYTKGGLLILFSWLLWNDLCLMLMENVAPQLMPLLLKNNGASNREIAFFTGTLVGAFTIWINPVVSTWSDRYRGPHGRRRPFLIFATPFCAASLAAIPFMPDLFRYLNTFPKFAALLVGHAALGPILFLGICNLCYQVFNSVILAIFTYYFWDVVPGEVLGQFSALTKVASTVAVFVWNYFLFGLTAAYTKQVFVGVAAFFLVAYLVSLWRVKEGHYPPAPASEDRGWLAVVRSYFVDCFTPYYASFILANAVFQVGNASNTFQIFFFRDELHLDYDAIGKIKAIPTLLVVLIGYPAGWLVDRLAPDRVMISAVVAYGAINIGGFYLVHGRWSLFVFLGMVAAAVCLLQVAMSVFTVEFFPRAKLGQFCSANAMTSNVFAMFAAVLVGAFFDWVREYRYALIWSAVFYLLSAPLYVRCCRKRKLALMSASNTMASLS